MQVTFTPLADEKLATATKLVEVATVKPSGYLIPRAIVTEDNLGDAFSAVRHYFEMQGRPEPVIYWRAVGTVEWLAEVSESEIPDELPEDFK